MLTLEETVEVTRGALLRRSPLDGPLQRAVHDSRQVRPGDLFVALPGKRTDGHLHLAEAYTRGARAALVTRTSDLPQRVTNGIVVEDAVEALYRLAAAWRERLTATFVAITGSCGKTGTRAAAAHLLRGTHAVYSARENYNTEIGVPLALLEMDERAAVGLFELGTERPGEIAPLARLVAPDLAVVTRIGHGHLAGFGSLEAIADEKWQIVAAPATRPRAVINGDDPLLAARAAAWDGPLVRFGTRHGDLVGSASASSPPLRLTLEQPAAELAFNLIGAHQATVALAAVAVALELGVGIGDVVARAPSCAPQPHRLELRDAPFGAVLDDSYNANPESTQAALEALATLVTPIPGRAWVFGEMFGLGAASARWHRAMLGRALEIGVDPIFPVGDAPRRAAADATTAAQAHLAVVDAQDMTALAESIARRLRESSPTVLLVKGSRDLGLDRLVAELTS